MNGQNPRWASFTETKRSVILSQIGWRSKNGKEWEMSEYADKALIELRQLVDNAQTALDGLSADYDSTHLTRARAITQELLRDLPHIPESEKTDPGSDSTN